MTRSDSALPGRAVGGGRSASLAARPLPEAIKVLLPVWGVAHVRQFLEFGLPALLAPGNLPALAGQLPCEFVAMTSREDAAVIVEHRNWHRLGSVCRASIVAMDDIISETSYSVTITLAYERGMRAAGGALTDTCFLFLVSDYVFADGALAAVLARVMAGASGVLAGNFQCEAEGVAPELHRLRDASTGALAVPARDLVRLALDHLHQATRAAIVDRAPVLDAAANRLFWQPDADTLVGRFYLLHMIGIRPEVEDFAVAAACDYGFIPELCPSRNVVVLDDSDDYFVVEMQPRVDTMPADAGARPLDPRWLGARLSAWTTARHRQNVQSALLFHAGPISPRARAAVAHSAGVVEAIAAHLAPQPMPHRDHPYWIGGLALHRAATGRALAPEAPRRRSARHVAARLMWGLRLFGFGRPPDVRPWHPRWPDFRACRNALRAVAGPGCDLVIVADAPSAYRSWLSGFTEASETVAMARLLDGARPGPALRPGRYDAGLLVAAETDPSRIGELAERIRPCLRPGGALVVMAARDLGDAPSDFDPRAAASAPWRAQGWAAEIRTVRAGRGRRRVQEALVRAAQGMRRSFAPGSVLMAPATAVLAAASLACNHWDLRRRGGSACSSVVLVLRAIPPASVEVPSVRSGEQVADCQSTNREALTPPRSAARPSVLLPADAVARPARQSGPPRHAGAPEVQAEATCWTS